MVGFFGYFQWESEICVDMQIFLQQGKFIAASAGCAQLIVIAINLKVIANQDKTANSEYLLFQKSHWAVNCCFCSQLAFSCHFLKTECVGERVFY
jgi:hypothetical protein